MKTSEFKIHLERNPDDELRFILPDGDYVPAHAHITEAGRVDKTFLDCGGTLRSTSHTTLQAWVADDTGHRLTPRKLAKVLEKALPLFRGDDLDLQIEFEDRVISQFPVTRVAAVGGVLAFQLGQTHTDCLAKEVCLAESEGCCAGGGGC